MAGGWKGNPMGSWADLSAIASSFCCVISGMLRKWDNEDVFWEGIMVQQ